MKWEAAARSLLRAPFLRSRAEGRASPSPPAWWPTALTFRARCQPHLLTQAFANKGSSHCSALSFEDASSFAYLLLPNIWHWNSWIQIMESSPDGETSDSCIHIRPFSLQQILTASNLKNANASAQLPKKFHTGFWKQCAFPFFCLLFWKPENSLPKQHARVNALQGNPGRQAHKGLSAQERSCSGGNLSGPKSSLLTLSSRKKSGRLIFP